MEKTADNIHPFNLREDTATGVQENTWPRLHHIQAQYVQGLFFVISIATLVLFW